MVPPEFEELATFQLRELWTNYGDLSEIWFDGGYNSGMVADLKQMLTTLQPNATTFGGSGIGANPACWVGTETGLPVPNNK